MSNSAKNQTKKSAGENRRSIISIFDWRSWSLFAKMASTIIILVSVIVIALSTIAYDRAIKDVTTELYLRSESRLNTLTAASLDAVYWLDVDTLNHLADRMVDLEGVEAVHFFDQNGRVLIAEGDTDLDIYTTTLNIVPGAVQYLNSEQTLFEEQDDTLISGRSIRVGNQVLGAVSIIISTRKNKLALRNLQNQIVLIAVFAIVASSSVALMLSRIVTTPLKELLEAAKLVGEGELSQKIEISHRSNEIAQLGQAMETMRQDLSRLYNDLEYQVEQRTIERERFEILNQFISNISHDFRTALSIISLETQLLQRINAGDEHTKNRSRLNTIRKMTNRLNDIIEDMFTVSRLDSTDNIELQRVNIHMMLNTLISTFQSNFQEKNLQLLTEFSDEAILTMANEQYLSDTCKIVINNALQHTPEQGTITIKTASYQNNIVIEIADTGIGIADEDQAPIFQKLYRVDSARSKETGGSGLGLSIARRITQLHKGTIQVKSKLGEGSTFIITIPLISVS